MKDNILLDTDVILDYFFGRQPFSEDAARILSQCDKKNIAGHITPVICSNVYYLLRKGSTHEKVIKNLELLLQFIDIITIDKEAVINALRSEFRDFEDALQYFAGTKSENINYIITRNVKDFKHSEIPVMTPGEYLSIKNTATD